MHQHRRLARLVALLLSLGLVATSCGDGSTASSQEFAATAATPSGGEFDRADAPAETTVPASPAAAEESDLEPEEEDAPAEDSTTEESRPDVEQNGPTVAAATRPAAPNSRTAPDVATTPAGLADQITQAERGLAEPNASPQQLADWGHLHQVAIRKLGYNPDWDIPFFEALPADLQARTLLHVSARRALIDLSSGYDAADFIPAWEIVEPEPATSLLSYYRAAEDATGIEWEYLAAINLVETGMGRIRGLSSAGAQGPMQFLPTTWAESGIGEGDINDPNDAINGAARYLVRRGGPNDMAGAIWGYNNSDDYVTAVRAYAEVLRLDPAAYEAIYNWEIYFFTEEGDIWLPTGFRSEASIELEDFLAANPWSAPDTGLRTPDS